MRIECDNVTHASCISTALQSCRGLISEQNYRNYTIRIWARLSCSSKH